MKILNVLVVEHDNFSFIKLRFAVLCDNSRTVWPTKMLMPFLSFSNNLFQNNHIIFQQTVDYFEIAHKTCSKSV